MAFFRTMATAALSAVLFLPAVLRSAKWALGAGGDVDFLFSRSRDPDWLGSIAYWLIAPPDWALVPMIAAGLLIIALNAWYSRRQFLRRLRQALENGLIEHPERIMGRPSYLRLKYSFHSETGKLSPAERVAQGKIAFLEICKHAVENDDYESYLVANQAGEWLHTNARFFYASSLGYQQISNLIDAEMLKLHNHFSIYVLNKRYY